MKDKIEQFMSALLFALFVLAILYGFYELANWLGPIEIN